MHQLRMNHNLSQLTDALSKTSNKSAFSKLFDLGLLRTEGNKDNSEDDATENRTSEANILSENSSTAEFKNFLEECKRSYLSKLAYSCPTKLGPKATSPNNSFKMSGSSELKKSQQGNVRRSLYFDALPD